MHPYARRARQIARLQSAPTGEPGTTLLVGHTVVHDRLIANEPGTCTPMLVGRGPVPRHAPLCSEGEADCALAKRAYRGARHSARRARCSSRSPDRERVRRPCTPMFVGRGPVPSWCVSPRTPAAGVVFRNCWMSMHSRCFGAGFTRFARFSG